ncbi:MAG: 2-hydroxyacyl-CoA dehydratase family protein [Halobacteriota archaeon]|nr:2-hydroxyacyl-CoA dehydratase family protein [Halobacteriota archaeon]
MSAFNDIIEMKNSRIDQIKEERESGKKVLGFLCTYVPEEMIDAAGMTPYRIFKGGKSPPVTTANAYYQRNMCPFPRACLGNALAGEYDFLDGVVSSHTCDGIRRLPDLWKRYAGGPPFFYQFDLPKTYTTDNAFKYFKKDLIRFKAALEGISEEKITEEKLAKSIEKYNRTRILLKRFYSLRKGPNPPISGVEALEVVKASMVVEKESFNKKLSELCDELAIERAEPDGDVRILVSGSILADGDDKVVGLIESSGGRVVTDDLCTGSRYFWDMIEDSEDPMDAICDRYLRKVPCSRMKPSENRLKHVIDLASEYQVDGVVYNLLKFCETFQYDYPIFKNEIEKMGIPILRLESDYTDTDVGQLRTRIEAFTEMIKR